MSIRHTRNQTLLLQKRKVRRQTREMFIEAGIVTYNLENNAQLVDNDTTAGQVRFTCGADHLVSSIQRAVYA